MTEKVLLIGLDGVTFDWLDRLIADGRCPTLARLLREGARGELGSAFPPITAVAWTSLATGKNPGKHGIFEFILPRRGGRSFVAASAAARDGEALWDILSRAGRRVIVTNFPCTYPPSEVNGLMIADFLTPRGRRDFTYPHQLLDEIEEILGPYRLYLTETYAPGNIDAVVDELLDELEYKSQVNRYLMRQYEWDVFITHIWGTDRIQHELWHVIDPTHPRFDRRENEAYAARVYDYWEQVDKQISHMVEEAGSSCSVWIVSDHGFGPVHKYCSFNLWLLQEGFLRLKRSVKARLKRWLFRCGFTPERAYRLSRHPLLARIRPPRGVTLQPESVGVLSKLFLSFEDVDWAHTTAYSKGNYGQIFINVKGREPEGIVQPGREYERVRAEIISRLRRLCDPETGRRLIGPIWTREELYYGHHLDEAPDICFLPQDMRYLALGNTDFHSNRFVTEAFGNSGSHRMEGIFIARGRHLRSGVRLTGLKIYDVLPSILYQLGVEIPDDVDGRVVDELFEDTYRRRHAPRFVPAASGAAARPKVEFTPEEEAEIEARLRNLGYLG